jgi:hypothetical protein
LKDGEDKRGCVSIWVDERGREEDKEEEDKEEEGGGNGALGDVIQELERPWTRGFFPRGLNGPRPSPRDDDWIREGGGGSKKRTGITRGPPKKEGGKVKHSPTAPPRNPKPANDDLTPPGTPVIAIACRPACPCNRCRARPPTHRSLIVAIAADDIVGNAPLRKIMDRRRDAMNQKKKNKKAYQQGLKSNGSIFDCCIAPRGGRRADALSSSFLSVDDDLRGWQCMVLLVQWVVVALDVVRAGTQAFSG